MATKRFTKRKGILVVRELFRRYFGDGVSKSGAELAYFFLFSFFPLLMLVNALLSFFQISAQDVTEMLAGLLPADVIGIIAGYFQHLSSVNGSSFLLFGLFFTIYFSQRAVGALLVAINKAYRITEKRPPIRGTLLNVVFSAGIMTLILFTLMALIAGKNVLLWMSDFVPLPLNLVELWTSLRFLLIGAGAFLMLLLLYYVAPYQKLSLRAVLPGTLGTLAAWLLLTLAFSYYVENMARYPVIYGSLGAVIVLLLWLYLTGIVLVMGSEFNHILEDLHRHKLP